MRTASLAMSRMAKVPSTCDRWSRWYRRRSTVTSSSTPITAVAAMPAASPIQNELEAAAQVAMRYAPTM